jgi:hypothetical protein
MHHGHYIVKLNQKQLQHSKQCNAKSNWQATPNPWTTIVSPGSINIENNVDFKIQIFSAMTR